MQTPTAIASTVPPARGRRTRSARAMATRSAPPTMIRAAPTATGEAAGPSACAVPVVPKQTAARRTCRRALMVHLFHNQPTPVKCRAAGPESRIRRELLQPPPRDVDAAHEPHPRPRDPVGHECPDRRRARRLPRPPRVRDDGYHRRAVVHEQLVEPHRERVEVVAR